MTSPATHFSTSRRMIVPSLVNPALALAWWYNSMGNLNPKLFISVCSPFGVVDIIAKFLKFDKWNSLVYNQTNLNSKTAAGLPPICDGFERKNAMILLRTIVPIFPLSVNPNLSPARPVPLLGPETSAPHSNCALFRAPGAIADGGAM